MTRRKMDIRAGTSGYSYREWRGSFYPPELHQDEWLGYYASRLPAVEINNTFYRMPRSHVVETWRDSVPESFRFVIKASRRITHQHRLKDVSEPLSFLLSRADILGNRLGALLFQLPPNMTANVDRLRTFQAQIPDELPVAFEFRHPSWQDDAVLEALADRGHALVVSHDDGADGAIPELPPGPLAYLRLRASDYGPAELDGWRQALMDAPAERAFVFFKHEDAGAGARMAERFLAGPASRRAPKRAGPQRTGGQRKGDSRRGKA